MKSLVAKYLVEFIVIITGISLSFYVEKLNQNDYKENLKNQSLKRILNNIEIDTGDFEFNLEANRKAIYSTDWITERNNKLQFYSKDSVGFHLNRAISYNTIFLDNQEEYRGLQNSGLIELIENESIVINLQRKYIVHEFFKKIETYIMERRLNLDDFAIRNLKYKSYKTDNLGLSIDRVYIGKQNIPDYIIESLKDKRTYHNFYIKRIESRVEKDINLVELIKNEING